MSHEWDCGLHGPTSRAGTGWRRTRCCRAAALLAGGPPAGRPDVGGRDRAGLEPRRRPGEAGRRAAADLRADRGLSPLRRDDTHALLSIRSDSYKMIRNKDFGDVINAVLGLRGRRVRRVRGADEPLRRQADRRPVLLPRAAGDALGPVQDLPLPRFAPGTTGRAGCAASRPTCGCSAPTPSTRPRPDGRIVGFTIRHTSNWEERVAEVRQELIAGPRGQREVGGLRRAAGALEGRRPPARGLPEEVPAGQRRHGRAQERERAAQPREDPRPARVADL